MTQVKDTNLVVRVSPAQKRQVELAAGRSGLSLSDYVRFVLAAASQSKTIGSWIDSRARGRADMLRRRSR